jgi:Xaa-Pro aminopeptidase
MRQRKVLEAIERAGLDAVFVTANNHLRYCTGYHGYATFQRPFPLILAPGRVPTCVVREYDEKAFRADSCVDEIVTYLHMDDFSKSCAEVLKRFGIERGRIDFELNCWNLAPADVAAVQAELPNIEIVDASKAVWMVTAVKSELEIQAMREAMKLTDIAVRTFHGALREGITEIEMARTIAAEVEKAGGDLWHPSTNIFSGERTKVPHLPPSRNAIRMNEPAYIELGGAKYGYAAGIVRGAIVGRHAEAEGLHALAVDGLEAGIAAIKPGVSGDHVNAAVRGVIEKAGRPRVLRSRTGYQTGIHWGGRGGNVSIEPGSKDILEAGMTLHMPIILFGESGILFGTSEHLLVTQDGADVLGKTPHTLHFA